MNPVPYTARVINFQDPPPALPRAVQFFLLAQIECGASVNEHLISRYT